MSEASDLKKGPPVAGLVGPVGFIFRTKNAGLPHTKRVLERATRRPERELEGCRKAFRLR